MSRPLPQRYYAGYTPSTRNSLQNYDSRIQLRLPTRSPPKTPSPPSRIFSASESHNPSLARLDSSNFLHPNSVRHSADRRPPLPLPNQDDEITELRPLPSRNAQNFTVPRSSEPLRTHSGWHKSRHSCSTLASKLSRPSRWWKKEIDEHTLAILVTLGLALFLALVLPLAAFLPPKYVVPLPVNVLVPLYMNPEAGGWDRLVDSVIKHSDTNFTIIINPSNGPGTTAWPSGSYITEIQKLNKLPNVATIGYIDTQHGQRANASVLQEIETYAGWNKSQIALSGIFFDHTPAVEWDDNVNGTAQAYLRNISATVKSLGSFDEPRMVVFNPGTIPAANLSMNDVADITVVFEGAYNEMPAMDKVKGELSALQQTREGLAYWVYSVPAAIGRKGVRKVVDRTRRNVEWLFLSSRWGEDRYEGYSDGWEEFLDLTW